MTDGPAYDLVVRGGSVVDGSGAEPRRADVAVSGGTVAAVGDLRDAAAAVELDATGTYVLPGFIDAHSHADALLADPRVQEAYLCQGVTTLVLGQDGLGFAPTDAAAAGYVSRYFAAVDGPAPAGFAGGGTVDVLLRSYDGAGALNAALLVPAGSVRYAVVGPAARPATATEVDRMAGLVADGLVEGAVGVSTGLDYVPGVFADASELAAVCAPAAAVGGVYVSHLRGYSAARIEHSLAEAAQIGRASGVAVHVSHLHGRAAVVEPALERMVREVEHGVSFDSYPYLRGSSILAMLLLPPDLQQGGLEATLDRLADPTVRHRLRSEVLPANGYVPSIRLSFLRAPELAWAEGMGLEQAARAAASDLTDFVCDALVACELAVGCVFENGPDRTEEDLRQLLRSPLHLASSDAIFLGSAPHPRGWGSFARLLARHVGGLGDWTWGAAAWHLSGHAAERFQLGRRGRVEPGAVADLAVLDPAAVTDRATYESPREPATGVRHVLVAGVPVVEHGRLTVARPGRGIRRSQRLDR
ncbi:N-acyl-D-amino-acid deacylase [Motilibacter peucedani]|uniref:N-acyl-D-amino-acid deacylase n=1 Tax=Motilibacter peucedani TaxID=598650 RepID=A0A420XJU7_9ACTN|nr:amidohydrolase family protein [Motilibacter peucedani]RKS67890.1 N-acyl-D-amino-acid deacylase [Motilibacter peucedani]